MDRVVFDWFAANSAITFFAIMLLLFYSLIRAYVTTAWRMMRNGESFWGASLWPLKWLAMLFLRM